MQYISLVVNLIHDSLVASGSQLSLLLKVCRTVNTERGMAYFGSRFQMFLPMTKGLCCFWVFDQTVFHGSKHWAEEASDFMAYRKQGNSQKLPVSSSSSLCHRPKLLSLYLDSSKSINFSTTLRKATSLRCTGYLAFKIESSASVRAVLRSHDSSYLPPHDWETGVCVLA